MVSLSPNFGSDKIEALFEAMTREARTCSVLTSALTLFCLQIKAKPQVKPRLSPHPNQHISATEALIHIFLSVH